VVEWVRNYVGMLDGDRSMTEESETLSKAILDGSMTRIFG